MVDYAKIDNSIFIKMFFTRFMITSAVQKTSVNPQKNNEDPQSCNFVEKFLDEKSRHKLDWSIRWVFIAIF
jgi:hypothetical protein